MKLLPFLLYVVALGLFGLAGWTVYQMLPLWKTEVRTEATTRGQIDASAALLKGRSQGQRSTAWVYSTETAPWWATFRSVNLTGKPPPPPPDVAPPTPPPPPPVDVRPMEQLIELVGLVYDGKAGGKGGDTHVIVRFKQEANVEPPDWWQRENPPPGAMASTPARTPRDLAANPAPRGNQPQGRPAPGPASRPATALPVSSAGREVLQRMWVDDGGDPRRSATLWPVKAADGRTMGTIKLVSVSPDATAATFAREVPGANAGDPPQTKLEELIKTNVNLPQEVLRATRELQGRPLERSAARTSPEAAPPQWIDVADTMQSGNTFHVGTNDERLFTDNPDRFLDQLNFHTYLNKDKSARGLILKGVPAEVGSRFGLKPGDVLIEINGRPVKSRQDAYAAAKSDYQRGVRTFNTRWMINGQIVEKVYNVPTKKK
jgi:hypothetical protein